MTRRRRNLAITFSLLVHLALLVAILRAPPTPGSPGTEISVSLVDGRGPASRFRARQRPPPPSRSTVTPKARAVRPQPSDIPPRYVDLEPQEVLRISSDPADDPIALSVAAASAGGGQKCQIGAWLQAALQGDPEVQEALATMPRETRSVANAVMLWDVRWVPQPPSAVAGVSAIRAAMSAGIRAAPAECRTELMRGPEFLPLMDATGSTLLAVGSGDWRWADLVSDPEPNAPAPGFGRTSPPRAFNPE